MVDDRGTPIYEIISRVESSEAELTVSAREMLAIPVMEQVEAGQHVDWKQVERSIMRLLAQQSETRTTTSVLVES
jgi:hypothetical protein